MKRFIIITLLLSLIIVLSCTKKDNKMSTIDPESYSWDNVISKSQNTEVNIYMWGGSIMINNYIGNIIAPRLKEINNITLNRIPVSDIKDSINKLIVEKKAGKKNGSIDILWINGKNFKIIKDSEALWGKFAYSLPAMESVKESATKTDFGTPIEGYEAPWGEAQFNFIYDGIGDIPFTDYKSMLEYAKNNKGRFTYPIATDFTGSAFIRNTVIDILGYNNIINMSDDDFKIALSKVWSYFNELKPYLWKEGETYPESEGKLSLLFKNDSVDITMSYTINFVSEKIENKEYPETSKSFLFDSGTLFNNHYLSIPWNASNKEGALFVINHFLLPEAQIYKLDPKNWGDGTVLDLNKISEEDKDKINVLSQGKGMLSYEELVSKRVLELTAEKLGIIEEGWQENVLKD